MKIIFAAGGTGGHLYPAIAIADKIKDRNKNNDKDFLFLISNRGIERDILLKAGYSNFIEQDITGFAGRGLRAKIISIVKLFKSVKDIYSLIDRDDKVIITGGFVSAPVAIVAKLKRVDLYLHEQNKVMGVVNRFFASMSRKVFLSFELSGSKLKNAIITGNPIREIFNNIPLKKSYSGKLLIIGGSQGSRLLNSVVASSAERLMKEGKQIVHVTGKKLYDESKLLYGNRLSTYKNQIEVLPYIDNISDYLDDADIIISRSGSGAVFEILASRRVAIYIPFKAATGNHQYYNSKDVVDRGVALMITEDNLSMDSLYQSIVKVEANFDDYLAKLRSVTVTDSASIIVSEVFN